MKNTKKPRMENNGRSTDRATPVLPVNPGPSTSNSDNTYPCRFSNCDRRFTTATGRGVHERRAHADANDVRQLQKQENKKERWSEEEKRLMARKEAQLTKEGYRFINQELIKHFNRTLESIKGQRRQQEYKNLVQEYLKEGVDASNGSDSEQEQAVDEVSRENTRDEDSNDKVRNILTEHLVNLPPLTHSGFNAVWMNRICYMVKDQPIPRVLTEITAYLLETFPPVNKKKNSNNLNNPPNTNNSSKKKKRREDYARVQDMWKKKPGKCVKRILEDDLERNEGMNKNIMEPYWKAVFTRDIRSSPNLPKAHRVEEDLWNPITELEIKVALPKGSSAPGPDGLTNKKLKEVPHDILARLFSLFMWCGQLPQHLCLSRTVLIPKKKNAEDPGLYRPLTMSSVMVRLFHKVFANRLSKIEMDERQRAFRKTNGCAENIALLDMVLTQHRKKTKKLFLAVIDMAKAFDSISINAIINILRAKGLPDAMVNYLRAIYDSSETVIDHAGWCSARIHPTCGVKQGDPLSPILFNLVIDAMLKQIPKEIGAEMEGSIINVLAFADDLVLMASTEKGLQTLMDNTAEFLKNCGLEINQGKSSTIAIKTIPKMKKIAIDPYCTFKIQGTTLRALKRTDEWEYLGVLFTSEGASKQNQIEILEKQLTSISKAPLKPQQRMWALRNVLIPGLTYKLVMSRVRFGYLKKIDRKIRLYIRKWLHLPHDTPNGYFHASVQDGGLGVPSLRWKGPLLRLECLKNMLRVDYLKNRSIDTYLQNEIRLVENRLKDNTNNIINTSKKLSKYWALTLHNSIDGGPLRNSEKVPGQHLWITQHTRFLTGRDYINSCKLRINALPTRSRTARGRDKDRLCRAGCGLKETLNHITQVCHRTHRMRIQRHNAISHYLARNLIKRGFNVEEEPHLITDEGLRKPDIVATMGQTSIILDSQVVGEQADLERENKNKVNYYGNNRSLHNLIKAKYGSQNVITLAATISSRGVWSKQSAEELLRRDIIKKSELRILTSRVLIGSVACWNIFNRMTSTRLAGGRTQQGIG